MNINPRELDLVKLNSLTKYPSILTYHEIGEKELLKSSLTFEVPNDDLFCTEKINGVNSRIIFFSNWKNHQYIIGSREELLTFSEDLLFNPILDIVSNIKNNWDIHKQHCLSIKYPNSLIIVFGESYGGNISKKSRNYTNNKEFGYRVFDIVVIPENQVGELLELPIVKISSWREHGGQYFIPYNEFNEVELLNIKITPMVLNINKLPNDLKDMYDFLIENILVTKVGIDNNGKSEGFVIRNNDRTFIVKARFEDYERTLRKFGIIN